MEKRSVEPKCVVCSTDAHATPLLSFQYRDMHYWICPQHLPVLVHDPAQLAGKLPGAESLRPAEHHD